MPRRTISIDNFAGGIDLSNPLGSKPPYLQYANHLRLQGDGSLVGVLGTGTSAFLGTGVYGHDGAEFVSASNVRRFVVATQNKWMVGTCDFFTTAPTMTDLRVGMATNTRTTFTIHNNKLYGLDEANDMATWDGTTLTTHAPGVNTGPPRGIILGVWNGKMWVAKPNSMEVVFSEVFDSVNGFVATTGMWPTENAVTLGGSAESSEYITAGAVTPDGLFVTTNRACYLIYDSDDGFNTVVDTQGLPNGRGLASDSGMVYGMNARGVWRTSGRLPLEYISSPRIDEAFGARAELLINGPGFVWDNSYWVSAVWGSTSGMWEYNFALNAFMWHSQGTNSFLAGTAYFIINRYGTSPTVMQLNSGNDAYVRSQMHAHIIPTADGNYSISKGQPFELSLGPVIGEAEMRLQRVTIHGRDIAAGTIYSPDPMNVVAETNMLHSLKGTTYGASAYNGTVSWRKNKWTDSTGYNYPLDVGHVRVTGARGRAIGLGIQGTAIGFSGTAGADGYPGREIHGTVIARIELELNDLSRRHT